MICEVDSPQVAAAKMGREHVWRPLLLEFSDQELVLSKGKILICCL